MKIMNYYEIAPSKNPHGVDVRKMHSNEHSEVAHILLKAGENLKKHTTPVDVFFYILEGEGIVEIGEEKQKVQKDMLIDSPKNIPHCIYNDSDGDFRILVVKTPSPASNKNIDN